MSALMASVRLGTQRMAEASARFGADVLEDALAQLLDRTRKLVRRKLAETFDYGTHRFTDAIDSDGHGNGPFHLRFAIIREKGQDGEDRFIFDATETDDQARGPVNLLMNRSIPGMALGLFYLGGEPGQVCNAGAAAGAGRGAAARGLAGETEMARPPRDARSHDDARARDAQRPGQCGGRPGARGPGRLCRCPHPGQLHGRGWQPDAVPPGPTASAWVRRAALPTA